MFLAFKGIALLLFQQIARSVKVKDTFGDGMPRDLPHNPHQ
jgi:hypothetical protein